MAWQQIQFFAEQDTAEWLCDLLLGLGALSVTFEDTQDEPIYEPNPDTLQLWHHTTVIALLEESVCIPTFIQQLKSYYGLTSFPAFKTEMVADKNWEEVNKDQFKPTQFGSNLWICPSWCPIPDPQAINLLLDPGLAFGTGSHPTTTLCLKWLSKHPPKNKAVIDYGCGSGILAIAAMKLGASHLIAIDIHPQAVEATLANAQQNAIDFDHFQAGFPQHLHSEPVDLILANILLQPLITLAPTFHALLKPTGQLVVSGLLAEQFNTLMDTYGSRFTLVTKEQQEEWLLVSFLRKDSP